MSRQKWKKVNPNWGTTTLVVLANLLVLIAIGSANGFVNLKKQDQLIHQLSAHLAVEPNRTTPSDQIVATPNLAATSGYHTSHIKPQANKLQQRPAAPTAAREAQPTSASYTEISPPIPANIIQSRLANKTSTTSSQQANSLASNNSSSSSSSSLSNVRNRWRRMELAIGQTLDSFGRDIKQNLDEILQDQRTKAPGSQLFVTNQCRLALDELVAGLLEQKLWATQMFDSSAFRLPVGLLEGTLTDLGNFDECLSISNGHHHHQQRWPLLAGGGGGGLKFNGQYCSLLIKPPLIPRPRLHTACRRLPALSSSTALANQTTLGLLLSQNSHQFYYAGLRLGVCLPSKCSQSDVQRLFNIYLNKYELIGQVKSCQQQQPQAAPPTTLGLNSPTLDFVLGLDSVQKSILVVFIIILCLNLVGTLLDSRHTAEQRRKQALINLLLSNSLKERQAHQQPFICSSSSSSLLSSSSPADEQHRQHLSLCQPQDQIRAAKRNKDKKSWNYQVYCGSETTCFSNADSGAHSKHKLSPSSSSPTSSSLSLQDELATTTDELELDASSIGLQQNPLSADYMHQVGLTPVESKRSKIGAPKVNFDGARYQPKATLLSDVKIQFDDQARNFIELKRNHDKSSGGGGGGGGSFRQKLKSVLICFSLTNNLRSIGKFSPSASSGNTRDGCESTTDIKVIHGLRTISMVWIIFGHTIGLVNPEMMNNLFPLANLSCSSRLLQALLNATLAVNTFFMISGLVTVVSFARKCKSARKLITPVPDDHDNTGTTAKSSTINHDAQGASRPLVLANEKNSAGAIKTHKGAGCGSDFEISSIDSSNSIITSLSSSASSNRCIGNQSASKKNKSDAKSSTTKHNKLPTTSQDDRNASSPPANSPYWPKDFQPLAWLLFRYLRLTPAYATIIGLSILLPQLGSGPFWPETIQPLGSNCRSHWWLNLLYVNNFLETDKLCLIHSWYLSNDWQFFLLALILFATFYRSKKLTILLAVTAFLASSAATFVVTVANDFPPTIVTTSPAVAERWLFIHSLYYKPWPHVSSYLIGLLAGYLILIRERIRLGAGWRLACWLLFSLIGLAVLNSIYPWNMGLPVDPIITGLHSATFRALWSCCCAWLVFALVTRPRHPLALFLSWRGFQFTSRLTYCAYLVHPLVIYYNFGVLRERLDSSIYGQSNRFMATLLTSYLFALVVSLLIEGPTVQLQQLLIDYFRGKYSDGSKEDAQGKNRDRLLSSSSSLLNEQQQQRFSTTKLNGKYNYTSHGGGHNSDREQKKTNHSEDTTTDLTWTSQDSSTNGSSNEQILANSLLANSESYKFLMSNGNLIDSTRLGNNLNRLNHHGEEAYKTTDDGRLLNISASNSCCLHSSSSLLNHNKDGRSALSENSSSPLDEDFQRKLAQAIGRGFKIRSKIANGTIRSSNNHQLAKRFGPTKRFPATVNQQRASLSPIFTSGKDKPILKTATKRRSDQCGTFVPNAPTTTKSANDMDAGKVTQGQCHFHQGQESKAPSSIPPNAMTNHTNHQQDCNSKPMYLNEMLLISRQKLHNRSQSNSADQ